MKKLLVMLLALIMTFSIATILTACGDTDDETLHEHTYETTWTSDATHHYKKATCEHTTEVSEKAEHNFGADNKCSVCGYQKVQGGNEQGEKLQEVSKERETEIFAIIPNVFDLTKYDNLTASGQTIMSMGDQNRTMEIETTFDNTGLGAIKDGDNMTYESGSMKLLDKNIFGYLFTRKVDDVYLYSNIHTGVDGITPNSIFDMLYVDKDYMKSQIMYFINDFGGVIYEEDMFGSREQVEQLFYELFISAVQMYTGKAFEKTDLDFSLIITETNEDIKFALKCCPKSSWLEGVEYLKTMDIVLECVFTESELKSSLFETRFVIEAGGQEQEQVQTGTFSYKKEFDRELYNEIIGKETGLTYGKEIYYLTNPLTMFINGDKYNSIGVPFNADIRDSIDQLKEDLINEIGSANTEDYEIELYLDEQFTEPYNDAQAIYFGENKEFNIYVKLFNVASDKMIVNMVETIKDEASMSGAPKRGSWMIVDKINNFDLTTVLASIDGVAEIEINGTTLSTVTNIIDLTTFEEFVKITIYYDSIEELYKSY